MDRSSWPMWVRVGLWGVPTRTAAWVFVWFCVLIAVGCVVYGVVDQRFFAGGAMMLAALWYYLALRWVDQNGGWQ